MESIPEKSGLLLLVMCLLLCPVHSQRNLQRKDELIQDTVRKFLGVRSEERQTVPGNVQSVPPPYMMNLYEKYRSGQTPMQGNTVRSILAMRDIIADADMLIFNLTGLKSTEQILQSKLFLLKRRKPKGGKKRDHSSFRLTIGCLPNMTSMHYIDISLPRQKPEWHSYDISESVVSCRQTRKGKDSLLGLTLEIKRAKRRHRLVSFKRVIKQNSQPFVLIFSEDSQNQTKMPASTKEDEYDEIGDLLRAKANKEGLLPDGLRPPQSSSRNHRHRERRSSMYKVNDIDNISVLEHYKQLSVFKDDYIKQYLKIATEKYNNTVPSDFIRTLRTAIDKVRYDLNMNNQFNIVYQTKETTKIMHNQGMLDFPQEKLLNKFWNSTSNYAYEKVLETVEGQNGDIQKSARTLTSQRYRRSIADTLKYSTEDKESNDTIATVKTIEVINENYIPNTNLHPKSRRKNRKGNPGRKKKRKGKNRKLPFWWTRHDSRLHTEDLKHMCRRKRLTVDFAQLGWDDWIISPKSFNAHYCEGSCTFPLIKHTETSNHAAVQSLIHAMQINANIPTPCCVPSVTSPLTLLYFDEHGSLVLKSYPNMIVKKCGCR